MQKTRISDENCSLVADSYKLNPADYSRKIFGMYGGNEELVTVEARERLAGVIIDRFGTSPTFIKTDFGFRTSLKVMVSPTFFSWVMGFGADMRIISPAYVREQMQNMLSEISKNYE
jgi:predicted DNA-binding transcriptional regulator YafY